MWYFVLYVTVAVWVFVDAHKRGNGGIVWGLGTALLGPLVLPFYFADRNLKAGEIREGGKGWNVLKNFALFWTLTMLVATGAAIVGMSNTVATASSDAEKAGAGLGVMVVIGGMGALWFFPMVGALVLGLFLRKTSIVERGPTGIP